MDLQLHSKRALVTGSTARIRLPIATQRAAEDANVVINGARRWRHDPRDPVMRHGTEPWPSR